MTSKLTHDGKEKPRARLGLEKKTSRKWCFRENSLYKGLEQKGFLGEMKYFISFIGKYFWIYKRTKVSQ